MRWWQRKAWLLKWLTELGTMSNVMVRTRVSNLYGRTRGRAICVQLLPLKQLLSVDVLSSRACLNLIPLLFIVTTLCLQMAKVEAEEESLVI